MTLRVLHIGDLHFWHFSANPLHYGGKRVLGIGNLLLRRARKFRLHLAPRLVERLAAVEPDWILFSGDFTTTSLAREFTHARRVLDPLVQRFPGRVRAVPGNHDRYTLSDIRRRTFEAHLPALLQQPDWPFFQQLEDDLWLVGIDATTSNGLGSHGCIDPATPEAIRAWQRRLEHQGTPPREVWVLCHFPAEDPPHPHAGRRGPQLRQAGLLLDSLGELGVPVLFLHGHHHYRWLYGSPTVPHLVYLNAGAPLLRRGGEADLGFLELQRDQGATSVRVHRCDLPAGKWATAPAPLPKAGEFVDLQARE